MEGSQPDYRLEIIEKDRLYLVYEGGKEICLGFVTRAEAEAWVIEHSKWHQPVCCICGSAATRAADPWTTIQVSVISGAVKAHMVAGTSPMLAKANSARPRRGCREGSPPDSTMPISAERQKQRDTYPRQDGKSVRHPVLPSAAQPVFPPHPHAGHDSKGARAPTPYRHFCRQPQRETISRHRRALRQVIPVEFVGK